MTFLILVAIAIGIFVLVKFNRKDEAEQPEEAPVRSQIDLTRLPKPWQQVAGEHLALKVSESVTLTLKGSMDAAREVERYLANSQDLKFPDRAPALALLMSKLKVEVPEIEAYRLAFLEKLKLAAESAVTQAHGSIETLRAQDPDLAKDLLDEAEADGFGDLDGRPSSLRLAQDLRTPRPPSLENGEALLAKVNNEPRLLWAYAGFAGDIAKAQRVPDEENIQPWIALVELGLAVRGASVPPANLVTAYTLAELNEILKPEKPIRRKAAAIPLISGSAANRLPGIQRVFLVNAMDARTRDALKGFEWVRTQAALLLDTVVCAERAQVADVTAPRGTRGAHWSVFGDCCAKAKRLQERDASAGRRPAQLPPYHIGCEADVEVEIFAD